MKNEQTHEIEVRVPADVAWRALTDPDELVRWFSEEASVEPREGGAFSVSWGDGAVGRRRIDVWEPGRRLRLVDESRPPGATEPEDPLVQDWIFESRGGATVVRLVHSGFPDTADWAGIYDSMQLGWGLFFRALRHYLERHAGRPRESRYFSLRTPRTAEDVWLAASGREGVAANGSLPAAGARYETATAAGDRLWGEVVHHEPGRSLQLTVEPWGDGLVTIAVEPDDEETLVWATVATFGDAPSLPADRLAARLRRLASAAG